MILKYNITSFVWAEELFYFFNFMHTYIFLSSSVHKYDAVLTINNLGNMLLLCFSD